jgi:ComF family protein
MADSMATGAIERQRRIPRPVPHPVAGTVDAARPAGDAPPVVSIALHRRALRRAAAFALDLLLPARCLGCGVRVAAQGALCAGCWGRLTLLGPPWCAACGRPFELASAAAAVCAACAARPPLQGRVRSALAYDDGSRSLILRFKHGDQIHAAGAYGTWMVRAGAELLADADLLVPVPLHRWRLFARRYNQAALLAFAVARCTGVETCPDLLVRRRRTPPQGGLSRDGRWRNVAGAFAVRPHRLPQVEGRRIVLVDDVFTTGATLGECARVLVRAGAARVDALTLARVLTPGG